MSEERSEGTSDIPTVGGGERTGRVWRWRGSPFILSSHHILLHREGRSPGATRRPEGSREEDVTRNDNMISGSKFQDS